nr:PREDICTED: protein D3-like [Bemisia tabaci]XP_018905923.1 PREDICTED: protein D3-like [Bemisia tabaci]XP_018905924.1 PREDICTED: protein D3-like [Bemisia tabaci]
MVKGDPFFLYILTSCIVNGVYCLLTQKIAHPGGNNQIDEKTAASHRFKNWNASLKEAKVIPDVISAEVPQPLKVEYMDDNIEFGTLVEYNPMNEQPFSLDWEYENKEFYTIVVSDPDFPDPKKPLRKEYLHWMVTNMEEGFIREGNVIAPYVPPSKKHLATCFGLHRIVIVLYKQLKGKINVSPDLYTPPNDPDVDDVEPFNREKFSSKCFAKEHNLAPLAANYFTMQMDNLPEEYVR